MSGSVAEERIRAKAEAMFRRLYEGARIIHELVLDQGGVRIDLAAVTPDMLAVAEIKSERDVLKRLPAQVGMALAVAQQVWIFVAPKHEEALAQRCESRLCFDLYGPPGLPERGGWSNPTPRGSIPNPTHLDGLNRCYLRVERAGHGGEFDLVKGQGWTPRHATPPLLNPADPLQMLWRGELLALTRCLGAGGDWARGDMIRLAVEHFSGKEIRRGVCRMLRSRPFPRADERVAA